MPEMIKNYQLLKDAAWGEMVARVKRQKPETNTVKTRQFWCRQRCTRRFRLRFHILDMRRPERPRERVFYINCGCVLQAGNRVIF